jgi:hypothetical protein
VPLRRLPSVAVGSGRRPSSAAGSLSRLLAFWLVAAALLESYFSSEGADGGESPLWKGRRTFLLRRSAPSTWFECIASREVLARRRAHMMRGDVPGGRYASGAPGGHEERNIRPRSTPKHPPRAGS